MQTDVLASTTPTPVKTLATPQTREDFRRVHVGFPEVVDSTMMSAASCPQKFFLEYVLKLSTQGKSVDLHAGGAFAHAIQHVRLAFYRDGCDLPTALGRGTKAFIEFWGDYEAPENSPKDFTTVITALYDYFRQYPPATDELQPFRKEDGTPAVEFTFAIPMEVLHPVTGNPIIYGGRADLIGKYHDLLVVNDEKTTKALGASWARSWQMRGQFLGYCYGAQKSGLDVSAALIRGIALQKTQFGHMEVLEQYSQHQIERWWRQINYRTQHLADLYKFSEPAIEEYRATGETKLIRQAHEAWPFNFGDICSQYYGCEMLGMCTSHDPTVWYKDFDVRLWNPLAQDPTAESPEPVMDEVSWEDFIA